MHTFTLETETIIIVQGVVKTFVSSPATFLQCDAKNKETFRNILLTDSELTDLFLKNILCFTSCTL